MITSVHPVSDLRRDSGTIFNKIENNEQVFLTQHGHGKAVLLSMDSYNQLFAEKEQMKITMELLEAEREYELNPNGGTSAREALANLKSKIEARLDGK